MLQASSLRSSSSNTEHCACFNSLLQSADQATLQFPVLRPHFFFTSEFRTMPITQSKLRSCSYPGVKKKRLGTRQVRERLSLRACKRFVLGALEIYCKPPVPEMPLVNCYVVEEKRNRVLYPWKIQQKFIFNREHKLSAKGIIIHKIWRVVVLTTRLPASCRKEGEGKKLKINFQGWHRHSIQRNWAERSEAIISENGGLMLSQRLYNRDSVDSLCRDGTDTPYSVIQTEASNNLLRKEHKLSQAPNLHIQVFCN